MIQYTRLAAESDDYREQREELRYAELELMRQREGVAALRRKLPLGPPVEDYRFVEGPADLDGGDAPRREVRLSQLFTGPDRPLIVYHLMYGKKQTSPCPMCTMWVDGFNGVVRHVEQHADFAVAAAAELPALRAHARGRGWSSLRLLSCADNSFKYDLASEDEEGNQDPSISVFTRDAEGQLRHFYSSSPQLSETVNERGIDLFSPVWHLLDLTPQGRGGWYAELSYPGR